MANNELCPVRATIAVNLKTEAGAQHLVAQLISGVGALGTVHYTPAKDGFYVQSTVVCIGWRDAKKLALGTPWLPNEELCLVARLKKLNLLGKAELSGPCVRQIGSAEGNLAEKLGLTR